MDRRIGAQTVSALFMLSVIYSQSTLSTLGQATVYYCANPQARAVVLREVC